MKKNLITLAAVASFAFFASSASATCVMGCENLGNGGLADIGFSGHSSFEGTTGANSLSSGQGNLKNESQNFTFGEQSANTTVDITRTTGLPGSGCSGACQENMGKVNFDYSGTAGAGAMQNSASSTGYGTANSYTGVGGNANFNFQLH